MAKRKVKKSKTESLENLFGLHKHRPWEEKMNALEQRLKDFERHIEDRFRLIHEMLREIRNNQPERKYVGVWVDDK